MRKPAETTERPSGADEPPDERPTPDEPPVGQPDGDDAGREHGSRPDRRAPAGTRSEPTPNHQTGVGDDSSPLLEMRQIAGLTSGSVMQLHAGSFQFQESESDVGFAVVVHDDERVVVVPGTATAHVDEVPLTEATSLDRSVLHVGSACFTVRPPRPAPTAAARLDVLERNRQRPSAIAVPDLGGDEPSPLPVDEVGRSALPADRGDRNDSDDGTDRRWLAFLDTVRDARALVADRYRWLHPDPEELRSRLERLDPGLWERHRQHPLFGRVALAYATIPWEPRFDDPDRIPVELHAPIREMSRLPWVPVTANLASGPLGITGYRPAVLAAARNVVLSLACLSAPTDIVFSIVTAKGLIEDWSWTTALPNSLFPDDDDGFPIAVADGMVHFEGAGYEHEAVLKNEMGLIALAETVDELPDYCATVLRISPDGRCQISNHLGDQVPGTPIGVTAGFAASLAASIARAVDGEAALDDGPTPSAGPSGDGPFLADAFADELGELFGDDAEPSS